MGRLSHEECQKELRKMCMVHRDTVYFYYNVEKDTWYVEPNEVLRRSCRDRMSVYLQRY